MTAKASSLAESRQTTTQSFRFVIYNLSLGACLLAAFLVVGLRGAAAQETADPGSTFTWNGKILGKGENENVAPGIHFNIAEDGSVLGKISGIAEKLGKGAKLIIKGQRTGNAIKLTSDLKIPKLEAEKRKSKLGRALDFNRAIQIELTGTIDGGQIKGRGKASSILKGSVLCYGMSDAQWQKLKREQPRAQAMFHCDPVAMSLTWSATESSSPTRVADEEDEEEKKESCAGLHTGGAGYMGSGDTARLVKAVGDVDIIHDDDSIPAVAGAAVSQFDRIYTGLDSCAELVFPDGSRAGIGELTDIRVSELTMEGTTVSTRLWLRAGEIDAEVSHAGRRSDFRIDTPTSCACVRGTKFSVRYVEKPQPLTVIRVKEGVVSVEPTNAALARYEVAAGGSAEVGKETIQTKGPANKIAARKKIAQTRAAAKEKVAPTKRASAVKSPPGGKAPSSAAKVDEKFWNQIKPYLDADLLRAYLKKFSNGRYADRAKAQLRQLQGAQREVGEPEKTAKKTSASDTSPEIIFWNSVKNTDDPDNFSRYLAAYPKGRFVKEAKRRRTQLQEQAARKAAQRKRAGANKQGTTDTEAEIAFWRSVENTTNPDELTAYLETYPNGRFAALARIRLRNLRKPGTQANVISRPKPFIQPPSKASPPGDCKLLSGLPKGPDKASDAKPIIAACRRALAERPGDADLEWKLARALRHAKDHEQANRHFGRAAEKGHAEAMNDLGVSYALGWGIPKRNYHEAIRWYRKAADKGLAAAMTNLAALYHAGRVVRKDLDKARHLYRKAADKGAANAMNALGTIYFRGEGVPKNLREAKRWFRMAAERGHVAARQNLAALGESNTPSHRSQPPASNAPAPSGPTSEEWRTCAFGAPTTKIRVCTNLIENAGISQENRAIAYNNRCTARHSLKQYKKAIADCDAAIRLHPTYPNSYYNRGRIFGIQRSFDRALEDFNTAIRLDPNYAKAYAVRGYTYEVKRQRGQAIADYKKALAIDPSNEFAKKQLQRLGLKAPSATSTPSPGRGVQISIPARNSNAKNPVMTPLLAAGRTYRFEVQGEFSYWHGKDNGVDAVWVYTGTYARRGKVWNSLRIGGKGVSDYVGQTPPRNGQHRYSFNVVGGGKRVPVYVANCHKDCSGGFTVLIR